MWSGICPEPLEVAEHIICILGIMEICADFLTKYKQTRETIHGALAVLIKPKSVFSVAEMLPINC